MRIFMIVAMAVTTVYSQTVFAESWLISDAKFDRLVPNAEETSTTAAPKCCNSCLCGGAACNQYCSKALSYSRTNPNTSSCNRGLFGTAELLILRYHRADGARSGNYSIIPVVDTDDVDFRYQAAPRMTLGYRFDSGIGFRTRYFHYDADAPARFFDTVDASMNVRTFTIDMELFDTIRLGSRWAIELSGGIRYNEFEETMENYLPVAPIRENIFRGFGGVAGAEVHRAIGYYGSLYLRGRGSISAGDKKVNNGIDGEPNEAVILTNSIFGITELGAGVQYMRSVFGDRAIISFRSGYEWQMWHNYSSAFSTITSTPNNLDLAPTFAGPSDVGFHGFTLGMGLSF